MPAATIDFIPDAPAAGEDRQIDFVPDKPESQTDLTPSDRNAAAFGISEGINEPMRLMGLLSNPAVVAASQMGQAQGAALRQRQLEETARRAASAAGGGEVGTTTALPITPTDEDLRPSIRQPEPLQQISDLLGRVPIAGPTLQRAIEPTELPYEKRQQAGTEPPPENALQAFQIGSRNLIAPLFKPEQMALLAALGPVSDAAPIIGRAISVYFGTEAGKAVVNSMPRLANAKTSAEKLQILTEVLGSAGMAALMGLHAVGPRRPVATEPTETPKVERTPDAISQRSELTPIQEPGTLERASREPIDVQTGTQAESGIKGEAAPDDPKAIIRRQETTDNWLKAIAGNDPEKIRNAQEKLFGTQVDPQERQTILDDLNRARQAVRAPSDIGADVGQTAIEEGARTPQERERTGQQAGESGIDDPLKSLKASLESSKSAGWEAATGTVGEALRLLQDLSDPKKQARSAGNLLRMLQEELPEVPKETADRIKKEVYGSIQLRIAKKVPLEVSPRDRQEVVKGVRTRQEPAVPQGEPEAEAKTEVAPPEPPKPPTPPEGWTFQTTKQFGGIDASTLTPEQIDQLKAAGLKSQWEFTDRRKGSPTEGFTFYVREGATPEEIKSAHEAKVSEVEAGSPKSIPQEGGRARMSAEEVTKAVKEKHPNARIEVVDDPSADWNGQYTQDANGNFTGIKINSAFISSPAELAHVLEHEIAHGADFQKITRDLTPHLSEGEWSGILKDISHYPTGEMSWEVRARAIQKLADAWRGRSWFDKLVGHAQRVAEKLGFKTTRLGAERMAADGLAKAARSIEEAKGTSEGIEAKSRPAPEGEPGKEPEITGIAERISTARTAAGRIGEIEPGEGIAPKDAVEIGRGLMASGVDPVAAVNEAINSGKIDADIFPLARAQEEKLAQAAVDAERQFGRNSPEYREASQKDTDWLRKVKQLQTVWAQAGHGQQGGVEIDTGTFHGLARAHREATGKDFTPQQAQNADALANRGAQADQVAQNAAQAAVEHIDKEIGVTRSQNPEQRALDAAHKTVREWAAKKAELENKVRVAEQARQTALDKMEQDRQDRAAKSARETGAAIAKAESENKARVDKAEQDRAAAQAEVERTRRAMQSADRTVRAAAARENAQAQTKLRVAEQARRTALEKMQRDREARAGKQAQDVTQSQAEAKADAENRERVLKAQQAKTAAEAERARTQAALDAASKAVREAAARAAKAETDKRVAKANKAKFIWDHIKDSDYLDPKDGNADFDDVVNKTATDLGMTPDEVRKSLAVSRVGKRMMDEMYAKMAERRRIKTQAMVWLRSLETPAWARFVKSVPRAFFAAKVFGHGTVGMITHAGINIFDPAAWRTYWPNFIRQYSFVFKKGAHEAAMQDLVRDPNYTMWKRAGLQVDPFKFSDDYQNATVRSFMNKLGGLVGNRGFDALKTFRMARANQIWNRLSLKMQTPEMAQAIADSVNHATGVVKMPFRDWTALALFAPKLEASRWAFMIGDPAKAARIFLKGADATPAERHFAMSELRQKATIAGVYVSLLAVNQGLLTAMGSDQQVNMTDPIKSDYLSFKVAGHNLGIVGPMIGMVKLFGKLYHDTRGERTKLERLTPRWREAASDIGQYGRSKFSPFSGEVANVVTGSDFMGKPLPFSEDRMPSGLRRRGEEPYTWPEYVLSGATPIPIEEMLKEIWTDQGMSRSKAETTLRALGTLVTASTGARLSPDYEVQR